MNLKFIKNIAQVIACEMSLNRRRCGDLGDRWIYSVLRMTRSVTAVAAYVETFAFKLIKSKLFSVWT
jgi:hypothetical protein